MNIFVGTAGFSYKDWEGVVYPADLKKRKIHPLEYLAQFFDCCEINTSFYGHIRPNVGKSWCEKTASVNPNFQFTAKLFQGFTHIPRGAKSPSPFQLTVSPKDESLTREGLDSIASEGQLGAVLVQFPVSFKNADDTRDYLFSLVRKFNQYPLVLEIRHICCDVSYVVMLHQTPLSMTFFRCDRPHKTGLWQPVVCSFLVSICCFPEREAVLKYTEPGTKDQPVRSQLLNLRIAPRPLVVINCRAEPYSTIFRLTFDPKRALMHR